MTAALLALGVSLSACATNERLPAVPLSLAASAVPLDIADARFYADGDSDRTSVLATQTYMRAKASGLLNPLIGKPPVRTFLAMSGTAPSVPGFSRAGRCAATGPSSRS